MIDLYAVYRDKDSYTFIYYDDLDAFYHYDLSQKVIKFLEEMSHCQTITTSHNTDLLSNNIIRPDCLFILSKDKLTSIVNATNRELRQGHNLEKLYKSGEFNG